MLIFCTGVKNFVPIKSFHVFRVFFNTLKYDIKFKQQLNENHQTDMNKNKHFNLMKMKCCNIYISERCLIFLITVFFFL